MSQKRSGTNESSIQQQKKARMDDSITNDKEIKFTTTDFLRTKMKLGDKSA